MKTFQHENFYYENLIARKFPDLRYMYICMVRPSHSVYMGILIVLFAISERTYGI